MPQHDDKFPDWLQPWVRLLELLNLLVRDAIGSIAIVGLMRAVEFVMDQLAVRPWVWSVGLSDGKYFKVDASDIVHYGDLFTLLGFLLVSAYEVVNWMRDR